MAKRIIVTVEDFGQDFSECIRRFSQEYGFEFVLNPLPIGMDNADELVEAVKGFDAVIAGGEKWPADAIGRLKDSLKAIARFGSGYDKVDLRAAQECRIAVTNAPGMFAAAVAECTLGLLLSTSRKIAMYDRQIRSGAWVPAVVKEIGNKTVGLIGFGAIAKEFARLLGPFENTIYVYDIETSAADEERYGVTFQSVDYILEHADIVSLHVPLTSRTKQLVDRGFLEKMKKGAILVNTSRGGVINEADLAAALKDGSLAGAGLDVFEHEPINEGNPLLELENVVMNPHSASLTQEAFEKTFASCVQSIHDVFTGKEPICRVEE